MLIKLIDGGVIGCVRSHQDICVLGEGQIRQNFLQSLWPQLAGTP